MHIVQGLRCACCKNKANTDNCQMQNALININANREHIANSGTLFCASMPIHHRNCIHGGPDDPGEPMEQPWRGQRQKVCVVLEAASMCDPEEEEQEAA